MNWLLPLATLLALTANIIGVYLLIKLRERNITSNQRVLLIALCSDELIISVLAIVRIITLVYQVPTLFRDFLVNLLQITLASHYIFIMILLAMDRFLLIKLNIKYPIYCTPLKIKRIAYIAWLVSIVLFVVYFPIHVFYPNDVVKYTTIYLFPIYEFFFIVVLLLTIYSIFIKFKRKKREANRIRDEISKNNNESRVTKSKQRFNIYLPTIIIISFIAFTVLPNIIWRLSHFLVIPESVGKYCIILYPLGWCCDSVIYILTIAWNKRKRRLNRIGLAQVKFKTDVLVTNNSREISLEKAISSTHNFSTLTSLSDLNDYSKTNK